jgi:hypothetical protein
VGVDTGGGLTDSGEKTSTSKSAVSLFLICVLEIRLTASVFCSVEVIRRRHLRPHLSQQAQERSRPVQIRRQGRGEILFLVDLRMCNCTDVFCIFFLKSEKGAGNYASSLAEMTARSSHSGGELSQWIAMSKSDAPDVEKSLTNVQHVQQVQHERLGDRVDGSEKNLIDTGDQSHSIHGDVPASVPIESALVHASPVETAAASGGGVIDDSGPPDGIEADSSVKSKPLSAR